MARRRPAISWPATSNYNVLLVLDGLGVAELDALSKPAAQWTKAGHRPPLLFTRGQLQASADVFPIELLDMRQSHRVLFGEDPLADVTINHEHLRLQLERELNEKLLALREGYLLTGGRPKHVVQLLTSSTGRVPGRCFARPCGCSRKKCRRRRPMRCGCWQSTSPSIRSRSWTSTT